MLPVFCLVHLSRYMPCLCVKKVRNVTDFLFGPSIQVHALLVCEESNPPEAAEKVHPLKVVTAVEGIFTLLSMASYSYYILLLHSTHDDT